MDIRVAFNQKSKWLKIFEIKKSKFSKLKNPPKLQCVTQMLTSLSKDDVLIPLCHVHPASCHHPAAGVQPWQRFSIQSERETNKTLSQIIIFFLVWSPGKLFIIDVLGCNTQIHTQIIPMMRIRITYVIIICIMYYYYRYFSRVIVSKIENNCDLHLTASLQFLNIFSNVIMINFLWYLIFKLISRENIYLKNFVRWSSDLRCTDLCYALIELCLFYGLKFEENTAKVILVFKLQFSYFENSFQDLQVMLG